MPPGAGGQAARQAASRAALHLAQLFPGALGARPTPRRPRVRTRRGWGAAGSPVPQVREAPGRIPFSSLLYTQAQCKAWHGPSTRCMFAELRSK